MTRAAIWIDSDFRNELNNQVKQHRLTESTLKELARECRQDEFESGREPTTFDTLTNEQGVAMGKLIRVRLSIQARAWLIKDTDKDSENTIWVLWKLYPNHEDSPKDYEQKKAASAYMAKHRGAIHQSVKRRSVEKPRHTKPKSDEQPTESARHIVLDARQADYVRQICELMDKQNKRGIALLAGAPGSGKTLVATKTITGLARTGAQHIYYLAQSFKLRSTVKQQIEQSDLSTDQQAAVHYLDYLDLLRDTARVIDHDTIIVGDDDLSLFFEKKQIRADLKITFDQFRQECEVMAAEQSFTTYKKLHGNDSLFYQQSEKFKQALWNYYQSYLTDLRERPTAAFHPKYCAVKIEKKHRRAAKLHDKAGGILVTDEFLDYSRLQLKLLVQLGYKLIFCGDYHQDLAHASNNLAYTIKISQQRLEQCSASDNFVVCKLSHSYRVSPEVVEAANRLLDLKRKLIPHGSDLIDRQIMTVSQIAGCASIVSNSSDIKRFCESINTIVIYSSNNASGDFDRIAQQSGTALCFDVSEIKGSESERVILWDIVRVDIMRRLNKLRQRRGNAREQLTSEDRELVEYINRLFTAMTRARHEVFFRVSPKLINHPEIKKFFAWLTNNPAILTNNKQTSDQTNHPKQATKTVTPQPDLDQAQQLTLNLLRDGRNRQAAALAKQHNLNLKLLIKQVKHERQEERRRSGLHARSDTYHEPETSADYPEPDSAQSIMLRNKSGGGGGGGDDSSYMTNVIKPYFSKPLEQTAFDQLLKLTGAEVSRLDDEDILRFLFTPTHIEFKIGDTKRYNVANHIKLLHHIRERLVEVKQESIIAAKTLISNAKGKSVIFHLWAQPTSRDQLEKSFFATLLFCCRYNKTLAKYVIRSIAQLHLKDAKKAEKLISRVQVMLAMRELAEAIPECEAIITKQATVLIARLSGSIKDKRHLKKTVQPQLRIVVQFIFSDNSLNDLLFNAIKQKNIAVIKVLVEYGADEPAVIADPEAEAEESAKIPDPNKDIGYLHAAAKDNDLDVLQALLSQGSRFKANRKDRTKWKATPLHYAARSGNKKIVQHLITQGADIHAVDTGQMTPLFYAASNRGCEETAQVLIDKGADIHAVDDRGRTPLFHASNYEGCEKTVQLLINKGAKVDAIDKRGRNPLFNAASYEGCERTIEILIKSDVPIQAKNDGLYALHYAADLGIISAVKKLLEYEHLFQPDMMTEESHSTALHYAASAGRLTVVEYLCEKKADIHAKAPYGQTALYFAAAQGRTEVVKRLIAQGATNEPSNNGDNPIHIASNYGRQDVVEELLKHPNYDINMPCTKHEQTPLHNAAMKGRAALVDWLIKHKADVNKADSNGQTPLYHAAINGHVAVIQCLLNHGATHQACHGGFNPLHAAASNGEQGAVEELLKHPAYDINMLCERHNRTALHYAAIKGHAALVDWMINHEADIKHADNKGQTPLFHAALNGHVATIKILIEHGATNDPCNRGDSPLHIATWHNKQDAVKELLQHPGYDINMLGASEQTALHYAALEGHTDLARWLVANGADIHANTRLGHTALGVAAMNKKNTACFHLLKDAGSHLQHRCANNNQSIYMNAVIGGSEEILACLPYDATTCDETVGNFKAWADDNESEDIKKRAYEFAGSRDDDEIIKSKPEDIAWILGHTQLLPIMARQCARASLRLGIFGPTNQKIPLPYPSDDIVEAQYGHMVIAG